MAASQTSFGMRHLTVVPTNFEPTVDDGEIDDGEAKDETDERDAEADAESTDRR